MVSRYEAIAPSGSPCPRARCRGCSAPGHRRLEPDDLAELRDRAVGVALVEEHATEVAVRLGVVRLEPDGLAVLRDRAVGVALVPERVAEVVVRLGVVRLEPDGLAARVDRAIRVAGVEERFAEVVVPQALAGLSLMTSRYSAIAPSGSPLAKSTLPRLPCASA
jgi:hypothetical protein